LSERASPDQIPLVDEHLYGLALLAEPIEQNPQDAEHDPGRGMQDGGDNRVPEIRAGMGLDPVFRGVEALGVQRLPLLAHRSHDPCAATRETFGGVDHGGDHGEQEKPDAYQAYESKHDLL